MRGLRPGCEQSRGTEQRTFQQPSPATSLQAATLTDSVLAFCHCNKMHERISSENKRLTVFLGLEVSFFGGPLVGILAILGSLEESKLLSCGQEGKRKD